MWAIVLFVAGLLALPTAAQEGLSETEPFPINTITVIGIGTASGPPDTATLEIGVEVVDPSVSEAFSRANSMMGDVIAAIIEAGVAEQDIRTSGLNIFVQEPPPRPDRQEEQPEREFHIANRVRITVRDIDNLGAIFSAAIEAGANQSFGLNFEISDSDTLERDARDDAFADARAQAEQLAGLAGATLGDVLVVSDASAGRIVPLSNTNVREDVGGGGPRIQPGQLSVEVQLQVTFRITR
jgi:uncharacterized protein